MSERKDKWKRRLRAAGITAGAVGTKALISDFPKGVIDDVVEKGVRNKFKGQPFKQGINKARVVKAVKGRGAGRAAGGIAGMVTFPVFASGIKDMQGDTSKDKAKGMGKILGSGVAFQGLKGGVELPIESLQKGVKMNKGALIQNLTKGFKSRAIPGLASSAITAAGIAKGIKTKREAKAKGEKPSTLKVLPAAVAGGMLGGAYKGSHEALLRSRGPKGAKVPWKVLLKQPSKYVPKGVSRATTGALGAAVLGGITDKVLDALKKKQPKVKTSARSLGPRMRNMANLLLELERPQGGYKNALLKYPKKYVNALRFKDLKKHKNLSKETKLWHDIHGKGDLSDISLRLDTARRRWDQAYKDASGYHKKSRTEGISPRLRDHYKGLSDIALGVWKDVGRRELPKLKKQQSMITSKLRRVRDASDYHKNEAKRIREAGGKAWGGTAIGVGSLGAGLGLRKRHKKKTSSAQDAALNKAFLETQAEMRGRFPHARLSLVSGPKKPQLKKDEKRATIIKDKLRV